MATMLNSIYHADSWHHRKTINTVQCKIRRHEFIAFFRTQTHPEKQRIFLKIVDSTSLSSTNMSRRSNFVLLQNNCSNEKKSEFSHLFLESLTLCPPWRFYSLQRYRVYANRFNLAWTIGRDCIIQTPLFSYWRKYNSLLHIAKTSITTFVLCFSKPPSSLFNSRSIPLSCARYFFSTV